MPLVKQGVFIVAGNVPQNPPPQDGDLSFIRVDAPTSGNRTIPVTLASSDAGIREAWFTPTDNLENIASFHQIFVQSVRNGRANLVVAANRGGVALTGIIYGLID